MKENNLAVTEVPTQTAKSVSLRELVPQNKTGAKLLEGNFSIISGLKVTVEALVGCAELTVEELFALQKGSVMTLDQLHNAPLEIRLDGKPVASGTLVVVGENFGIRITDILAAPAIQSE